MIDIRFANSFGLYNDSPEELKQAYRNYKGCCDRIESLTRFVMNDIIDLKQAVQITNLGLCAGDWERIEAIRQKLNTRLADLRQAHEDFPRYQKIYTDLHHSLSGSRDLSRDSKAHEGS